MEPRTLQTTGPTLAPRTMSARQLRSAMSMTLRERIGVVTMACKTLIDSEIEDMKTRRDEVTRGIDTRFQSERDRYENVYSKPYYLGADKKWKYDENHVNAHMRMGVSLGMFPDAVSVGLAKIGSAVIGPTDFPIEFRGRKASETAELRSCLEALGRDAFCRTHWSMETMSVIEDALVHGTGIMRVSWRSDFESFRRDDGTIGFRATPGGLSVQRWPLLNCYVSHPYLARPDQQKTVIWRSEQTTVDLARCAMRFDVEERPMEILGEPTIMSLPYQGGRYVEMEGVWKAEAEGKGGARFFSMFGMGKESGADERPFVSTQAKWEVFERFGEGGVGDMIRAGLVTPEFLRFFRGEIATSYSSDGQPIMPKGEDLARYADSIPWRIVVAKNGASSVLLEFRPCCYRTSWNELTACRFVMHDNCFYGQSMDRVGCDLAKMADSLANDLLVIARKNADPPRLVDRSQINVDQDTSELDRAGGEVSYRSANTPHQAPPVDWAKPVFPPELLAALDRAIGWYNSRVMVNDTERGGSAKTDSETAREAMAQLAQLEGRRGPIIRRAIQDLVLRPAEFYIENLDYFNDEERLRDMAVAVQGEDGIGSDLKFPVGSGRGRTLADEFYVLHAGNPLIRREVAGKYLMDAVRMVVVFPEKKDVAMKLLGRALDALGVDTSDLDLGDRPPMMPWEELIGLMGGMTPEVREGDDHLLHEISHEMQIVALQRMIEADEEAGRDTGPLIAQRTALVDHRMKHYVARQKQEQMMMAAAQAAPGGGTGKPSATGDGRQSPFRMDPRQTDPSRGGNPAPAAPDAASRKTGDGVVAQAAAGSPA